MKMRTRRLKRTVLNWYPFRFVFLWAWELWLWDSRGKPLTVVTVTGWRSALVDTYTKQREHIWFCPWPLR